MENETAIINEEVVSPQETEVTNEEVVSPQGNNGPQDMSPEDFDSYINELKKGKESGKVAEKELPKEKTAENLPSEKKEAFKSFETEAEFQEFMNKTIGNRLKGAKQKEEKYNEFESTLRRLYPDKSPDDAIAKIVADVERQAAEESGKTVEEIREENELRADAEAFRAIKKQEEKRGEQIRSIQDSWMREEEQLKTFIPDFDFKKAMENKVFKDAVLEEGLSVSAAYIKALKNQPEERKRERVFEIGAGDGRGAEMGKIDPMQMNDEDFKSYIERIRRK